MGDFDPDMVERMAPRPYFSISFSLDIIRNVRAALARDEVTSIGGREGK